MIFKFFKWNYFSIQTKVSAIVSIILVLGFGFIVLLGLIQTKGALSETSLFFEDSGSKSIADLKKGLEEYEELGDSMIESAEDTEKEALQLARLVWVKTIKHMMLSGSAHIVGDWIEGQREITAFKEISIVRAGKDFGEEAFRDNKTIEAVNQILGTEEFSPKEEKPGKTISAMRLDTARKAERSKKDQFLQEMDENGEEILTLMAPLPNDEECQSCHGDDHDVRGILVVSVSRDETLEKIEHLDEELENQRTGQEKRISESRKNAEESLSLLRTKTVKGMAQRSIAALFVTAVTVFLLVMFLRRSVIRPIKNTVALAEEIAGGNLSLADLNIKTEDEMGSLRKALNTMKNNLSSMISKVMENSKAVSAGVEDISDIARSTDQGAKTQTNQVSNVMAAMEEISTTITEMAKNSDRAAKLTEEVLTAATNGGERVQDSIEGMNSISKSVGESAASIEELGKRSNKIGEVVTVIDDIADQTNLLALNAAIEAARAGEQGRGFAVVADEVRKLAERTTRSTQEIAGMIKSIQSGTTDVITQMKSVDDEVKRGAEVTNTAVNSLSAIIQLAGTVADMVNQIAAATEEQSAGTEEVTSQIQDIAKVSEETASGAGRSSESANQLKMLAGNLQKIVEEFKV